MHVPDTYITHMRMVRSYSFWRLIVCYAIISLWAFAQDQHVCVQTDRSDRSDCLLQTARTTNTRLQALRFSLPRQRVRTQARPRSETASDNTQRSAAQQTASTRSSPPPHAFIVSVHGGRQGVARPAGLQTGRHRAIPVNTHNTRTSAGMRTHVRAVLYTTITIYIYIYIYISSI